MNSTNLKKSEPNWDSCLSGLGGGRLTHVMDQRHCDGVLALQMAQKGE